MEKVGLKSYGIHIVRFLLSRGSEDIAISAILYTRSGEKCWIWRRILASLLLMQIQRHSRKAVLSTSHEVNCNYPTFASHSFHMLQGMNSDFEMFSQCVGTKPGSNSQPINS